MTGFFIASLSDCCWIFFFFVCVSLSIKLPKLSDIHWSQMLVQLSFLCSCLKWKSVWNLSLSREKTSAFLSLLTTCLFQISLANIGTRELKLLFYPPKCLEGFVKNRKKLVVFVHMCLQSENSPVIMEGRRFLQYKRLLEVIIFL